MVGTVAYSGKISVEKLDKPFMGSNFDVKFETSNRPGKPFSVLVAGGGKTVQDRLVQAATRIVEEKDGIVSNLHGMPNMRGFLIGGVERLEMAAGLEPQKNLSMSR